MKKLFFITSMFLLAKCLSADWLPDSIINDRNERCRTGYNVARNIVSDGNNIYAVWIERWYNIYIRAKNGGNWSNSELVSSGSPGGIWGISAYPSIAVKNSKIYVVWEDYRTGDFEIFYRKFSGGWGSPIDISGDKANSRVPVITLTEGGKTFIIWQDDRTGNYEIYSKINDNGTWGIPQKISSTTFYAGFPTVTHYGETVYVVWEEEKNNGYELYTSTYSGGNWSTPVRITNNSGMSQNPSICADPSGKLHLVWMDDANGNFIIYYSNFDGGNWTSPIPVTDNSGEALYPQIASDPYGIIHLVWADNREGNYEIFHKSLVNGVWGAAENISLKEGFSLSPHITCSDNGDVHIIWYDWVNDSDFVSPQIHYKRYNPAMNILSNSIVKEISTNSVRFIADIPKGSVKLFRQDTPYPVFIKPKRVEGTKYEWTESLSPGEYSYILQVINGTDVHYSNPIQVIIPENKGSFDVSISPNPFTEKTEIRLTLSTGNSASGEKPTTNDQSPMTISIYDVTGKLVRNLSFGADNSSLITFASWDGKDNRGKSIKSGIYFIKLLTPDFTITKKLIKM